ncbi:MAG: type II toxin-antitoxin system RelE/ParE family toxin [Cyanothece sp. SIO2G6]|nr:type II toxin-antitoxin system RelE/ParE family toxin [Cyanothece sp. SIO2G6]
MTERHPVNVEAAPTFKRNIRKLTKKYRSIQSDVQPIIEQLQRGELLGDRIPDTGYNVFKVRVANSDNQKGKSGGYRLIYYLQTAERIILLTIYSKTKQADIAADDIRQIITQQSETNR